MGIEPTSMLYESIVLPLNYIGLQYNKNYHKHMVLSSYVAGLSHLWYDEGMNDLAERVQKLADMVPELRDRL